MVSCRSRPIRQKTFRTCTTWIYSKVPRSTVSTSNACISGSRARRDKPIADLESPFNFASDECKLGALEAHPYLLKTFPLRGNAFANLEDISEFYRLVGNPNNLASPRDNGTKLRMRNARATGPKP